MAVYATFLFFMQIPLTRMMLAVVAAVLLTYTADLVQLRLRGWRGLGRATVRRFYAVHHKDGKTEFFFRAPEDQPCAQSLFPQRSYSPCWYLRRHPEQEIEI